MKKELVILLYASSFFLLAGGLFGPVYAVFVQGIGGNLATAGTAYGLFLVTAGTLMFFTSRFEEKISHPEKLVTIGYALASLGFLGYLFIKTPLHLYLVQFILGAAESIWKPAFDGVYSQHLEKRRFISQWGLFEGFSYLVAAAAAALGGLLADLYGFKFLFLIMLILSLISFVVSMLLILETDKNKKKK